VSTPIRKRDAEATRRSILEAARRLFAADGYTATTVKRIADAAGIAPNLITRYFGGKEGLFLAASSTEIAADEVYAGDLAELGARLARSIVRRWTSAPGDDPLLVLLRAAGERSDAAETLARFLDEHSLARLEDYLLRCGLAADDARTRAIAIDTLTLGLSSRFRILRDDVGDGVALEQWLAEAIQRLATGT
jgi:AcrR family transcriptional regulator